MNLFDEKPGSSPSSASELAELTKANPELAEAAAAETPAQDPPTEQPSPAQDEPAGSDPAPADSHEPGGEEGRPARQKTVPAAALAEERKARRALEDRLAAALERLGQPQQPQAPQPQAQQEQPPDPEQDPIGALKWTQDQLAKQTQINQGMALATRVQQDYHADALRFAAQQPDFPAAYEFLVRGRVAELQAQGYQPDAIRAHVQREEFGIALSALQANQSPAQRAYELAKARGYKPEAQKPAAASTPAVDPALAEAKKRAAAGIAEGGSAPKGELSVDDITGLKGVAFDDAFEKLAKGQRGRSSLFRHG